MNGSACNSRRPISTTTTAEEGSEGTEEGLHAKRFPGVDFSRLLPGAGLDPCSECAPPGRSYKAAFGVLRARARGVLASLDARPEQEERIAVVCHGTFMRAVISEVLGLNDHHLALSPQTGTSTEVWRIQSAGGERYWELKEDAGTGKAGHGVIRFRREE